MRSLSCVVLTAVVVLVSAVRTEAAPIVYDFTVTFDSGPLSPQSFDGTLSVDGDDCPGGICDGVFFPDFPNRTLLTFDITIDGVAFDITDDINYPDFPGVIIDDGNVTAISYITNPTVLPFLLIALDSPLSVVQFRNAAGVGSEGTITSIEQSVPEPASVTLLGLGLAGIAARRWRQRRNG